MKILNQHKALILIALIGTAYRFFFAWHHVSQGILIADDAYYYFTIARNIIDGFGPTFDRLAPTNGFHPLWLLTVLPIFKFAGTSLWLPVKLALSLITIFDLVSGILIYRTLDEKGYRVGGLIASGFWFLSAFTVFTSLRGMEASLAVMMALLFFRSIMRVLDSNERVTYHTAIVPGILFGLSCLARTDYLILLGLPIIFYAICKSAKMRTVRGVTWFLIMGGVSFLLFLPWLIWNYLVFGYITQVSGAAKLYYRPHFGVVLSDELAGTVRWFTYNILAPITFPAKFLSGEEFQSPRISLIVILGALSMSLLPLIISLKSIRLRLINGGLSSVVFISVTCIVIQILLYGVILRMYAGWYALLYYGLLSILLGIAIPELFRLFKGRKLLIIVSATILIVFNIALHPIFLIRSGPVALPPESFYGSALREIVRQYPDSVILGAFNAGAIGYIAPQYGKITVINLDCLVNNRAYEAARKNQYFSYITNNIDVLYEHPFAASAFLTPNELDSLCKIYTKNNGQYMWGKKQNE